MVGSGLIRGMVEVFRFGGGLLVGIAKTCLLVEDVCVYGLLLTWGSDNTL
jgi:hypothetical protein